ncbi:hypothetical protein VFPFJ_11755 [Purpureocillium lilacinum]|uniref:Uncharacterized protein n=2 Tax=Purpureocillium lilacinum TaxID=33203 RepID=A0A179EW23_PURLI|nr:hypothetical protein VFPFJ_11755 [Purpureocillium lilacinum]OAQ57395.1 hypothetical protein VFPFJ_11755 [Purpureocillium lilacinum]OAQ59797.1 hypothetical protein VFPBJ_11593 [Purpureocillium lilacinum]PWI64304.1 hypothetical protein PCL_11275 [Purpureocillium lilacinum]
MPSSLSSIPDLGLFYIPTTAEVGVAGAGLYNKLVEQAYRSNETHIFDLGRFWSVNAICAEPGAMYHLAVHFLFSCREILEKVAWEDLKDTLAVDAKVYRSPPGDINVAGGEMASMTLLFSSSSPLVGPMTYGEVQRAVEHYLGWCDRAGNADPPWKSAWRITAELVPRSEVKDWLVRRQDALEHCDVRILWRGTDFDCLLPCQLQ